MYVRMHPGLASGRFPWKPIRSARGSRRCCAAAVPPLPPPPSPSSLLLLLLMQFSLENCITFEGQKKKKRKGNDPLLNCILHNDISHYPRE